MHRIETSFKTFNAQNGNQPTRVGGEANLLNVVFLHKHGGCHRLLVCAKKKFVDFLSGRRC